MRKRILRGIILLEPRDIASRRKFRVFNHLRNLLIAKLVLRRRVLEQRTFRLVFLASTHVLRKAPRRVHHDRIDIKMGWVIPNPAALVLHVLRPEEAVLVSEAVVVAEAIVNLIVAQGRLGGFGFCYGVGVVLDVGAGVVSKAAQDE